MSSFPKNISITVLTGFLGSGKTTIGREVYNKLKEKYSNTIFLDGDNFREIFGRRFDRFTPDGKNLKTREQVIQESAAEIIKNTYFCYIIV